MFTLYIETDDFPASSLDISSESWCPFLVRWVEDGKYEYTWVTLEEFLGQDLEDLEDILERDRLAFITTGLTEMSIYASAEEYLSAPEHYMLAKYREFDSLAALAAEVKMSSLLETYEEIDYWFPNGTDNLKYGVL